MKKHVLLSISAVVLGSVSVSNAMDMDDENFDPNQGPPNQKKIYRKALKARRRQKSQNLENNGRPAPIPLVLPHEPDEPVRPPMDQEMEDVQVHEDQEMRQQRGTKRKREVVAKDKEQPPAKRRKVSVDLSDALQDLQLN